MTAHKHSLTTYMTEGVTTLMEARRKNIKYVEEKTKGVVSKVIAELSDDSNKDVQQLALEFVRLDKKVKQLTEEREEMKKQLSTFVGELFDAEDAILTRVAQVGRFALQLKKDSRTSNNVVDYDAVMVEFTKHITPELRGKLDELVQLYTTEQISTRAGGFSVSDGGEKVVTPNLKEGLIDQVSKIISKFVNSVLSWSKKFDRRMEQLMRRAGVTSAMLVESIEKVEDKKPADDEKKDITDDTKPEDSKDEADPDAKKDGSDKKDGEEKPEEDSDKKASEDKGKHDDIDTDGLNGDDAGVQKYLDALEVVKEMATDNEDIKQHLTRSLATIMAAIPAQQAADADAAGEPVDGEPAEEGAEVVDDADSEKVEGAEDTQPEDDSVEKTDDGEEKDSDPKDEESDKKKGEEE